MIGESLGSSSSLSDPSDTSAAARQVDLPSNHMPTCAYNESGDHHLHFELFCDRMPQHMNDTASRAVAPMRKLSPTLQVNHRSLNLSSSSKRANSFLSKVYKQASELYLTRRLPECLVLLEQSIFPWKVTDESGNGVKSVETALIAGASRSLRVKIWTLYLTFLNDIVSLGTTEGRSVLGSKKWRELVVLVQNGTIWDEVVKVGYHGIEANVDAEVVANLSATCHLRESMLTVW